MAGAPWRLAGRWEVVPRPVIGGTAEQPTQVDFALLHPGRGIALVDLAPKVTVHAVSSLRQVLDAARLDAQYPGLLPITYCCLAPEEIPCLPHLLDAAFAAKPPLTVANADWTATVRALVAGLPVPVTEPARATTKGGRCSGMLAAATLLLLVVGGGGLMIFGLRGSPATPPRGGTVVDTPSLPAAPKTMRLSVATERLRATPGLQLGPSASEIGPQPDSSSSEPEAAAGSATAALAAATFAFPAPSLASQDIVAPPVPPGTDLAGLAALLELGIPPSVAPPPSTASAPLAVAVVPVVGILPTPTRPPPPSGFDLAPPVPMPASENQPAPVAAAQIAAPASQGTDLASLAALPELEIPPSVAPPPAAFAPFAVLPAMGMLPAPTKLPAPSGFSLAALPPPKSVVTSSLEPPAIPSAKVAVLLLPDPIGPERPHDGRDDDAQLLEAALPPPPPLVPAQTTQGNRSPPAIRTTALRPRGATAEVAPRQPANSRCAAILARLQLGETPSHADRLDLYAACAPRP